MLLTAVRWGPERGLAPERLDVAVVDGRNAAIGADLSAWRGLATERVGLAGGMLHAGFVDAHIHAIQGGLERLGCDLSKGVPGEDYLDTIAAYATLNPPCGGDASRA